MRIVNVGLLLVGYFE